MNNITYYTTIDHVNIYRSAGFYLLKRTIRHSGGCRHIRLYVLGSTPRDVLRYFFRERAWGRRFFSREIFHIWENYMRCSALRVLRPR